VNYFLVYVSSAVRLFSRAELDEILATSRKNNAALGISGILLYKDGNLMQLLEGDKSAVRGLYARIGADPRHRGLIEMWDGTEAERQFPDWSMAFRDLDGADPTGTPGYSEFLSRPLASQDPEQDVTHCQSLLALFRTTL